MTKPSCLMVFMLLVAVPCATQQRRTRETALGDGTIAEALRPGDEIVDISWPSEEDAAFARGDPPIGVLQEAVREEPFIAATVTVTAASGVLVQNNRWINTRFAAIVNDVIVTGRRVAIRDRIRRDQTIEFRARAGEITIGSVLVRAGVVARYPVGRRYLVLLGQRQSDGVWTIRNRAPLLIDGDRVRAVPPVESGLSGALLSDVIQALRTGRPVLLPRDQSDEDPEFAAWIGRLRAAAEKGDLAVIREACAPTLRAFFEEISREAALADLVEGHPWLPLRNALRLGVVRMNDAYAAPYTYIDDGIDDGHVAITGRRVQMRRAPAATAPVITVLSLDVLKQDRSHNYYSERFEAEDSPQGSDAWAKVIAPNGTAGYVYGRYVREALEMRFIFERVDGHWKITAYAAGD